MKAALDVHYEGGRAFAACVVFDRWQDSEPAELIRTVVHGSLPYRAGRFYERELPCLMSVLRVAGHEFEAVIIDGYVHLRADAGKGLGLHLYESLDYSTTVIGVAKNPLRVADRFIAIRRGRSKKPLYISAAGCTVEYAAQSILRMYGPHRIPALLKRADHHARAGALSVPGE